MNAKVLNVNDKSRNVAFIIVLPNLSFLIVFERKYILTTNDDLHSDNDRENHVE